MRNDYTETSGTGPNGFDNIDHRTFWRDSIGNRRRTDKTALNSQGILLSQSFFPGRVGPSSGNGSFNAGAYEGCLSVWPLEGRYTGSGADLAKDSSNVGQYTGLRVGWGSLIMQIGKGDMSNVLPTSRVTEGLTGELFGGGMYRSALLSSPNLTVKNRFVTASARYHGVDWNMSAYSGSATGETWATIVGPTKPQIIEYTASSNVNWTTNIDSGKNPWFDSYDDYSSDLRMIGKDYSIIPEFNISDHMEY